MSNILLNPELNYRAIYTANFYNDTTKPYDTPKLIDSDLRKGWDSFYFTNDGKLSVPGYNMIYIDTSNSNRPLVSFARQVKCNPHIFLPEYKTTLWIDSSKEVIKPLNEFISLLPFELCDFITSKHPDRSCVYQEIEHPKVVKAITEENANRIKQIFINEGFPERFGLQETQFLLRRNNIRVNYINEMWWHLMHTNKAYRDQIWLSYILFKLDEDILCIEKEIEGKYLNKNRHNYTADGQYINISKTTSIRTINKPSSRSIRKLKRSEPKVIKTATSGDVHSISSYNKVKHRIVDKINTTNRIDRIHG